MIVADIFIYVVYVVFGVVQYSYQGQYTFASAIQSTTPFNYRTAGNVLAIIGESWHISWHISWQCSRID